MQPQSLDRSPLRLPTRPVALPPSPTNYSRPTGRNGNVLDKVWYLVRYLTGHVAEEMIRELPNERLAEVHERVCKK